MATPTQLDPSRTLALRKKAVKEMKSRFRKARKDIQNLIIEEDAFGLGEKVTPIVSLNQRFAFQTDENKIASFQAWFKLQVENGILFTNNVDEPWLDEYVESAYKRGVIRGYDQVRSISSFEEDAMQMAAAGAKAEFTSSLFAGAESVARVQSLYTRNFLQLKGITAEMNTQLSVILAQALADGKNPLVVAREMTKKITSIEKRRALGLARTEIVRAQAEGQLDSFEKLGVKEVGVYAEWSTAGDDKVCAECDALNNVVLTIDEARGMLPRHPNCRCAWVPALKDFKQKGQKWSAKKVRRAVKKSILARKKDSASLGEAKEKTTWAGADTKIKDRKDEK